MRLEGSVRLSVGSIGDPCEHDSKRLGSIKDDEFLESLSDC
jgi:hypothetical protein